jgi:hypothetical protein
VSVSECNSQGDLESLRRPIGGEKRVRMPFKRTNRKRPFDEGLLSGLDTFPEMARREAIENQRFNRNVVKEALQQHKHRSTAESLIRDRAFEEVVANLYPEGIAGDAFATSSVPPHFTLSAWQLERSESVEVYLSNAVDVIDPALTRRRRNVLPEPAVDFMSVATWPDRVKIPLLGNVVGGIARALLLISAWPYQLFVAGGFLCALVATPLIATGKQVALIPLAGCFFFDGVDGGALRKQGASNSAIYLSCLTSHLNDIVLFIGVACFSYWHGPVNHLDTIVLVGSVAASLFASFARAAVFQTGIDVPKTWLERGVRLVAVFVAVIFWSVWPATGILVAVAIAEVVFILHKVHTTRVYAMYNFVSTTRRTRSGTSTGEATPNPRWDCRVRV